MISEVVGGTTLECERSVCTVRCPHQGPCSPGIPNYLPHVFILLLATAVKSMRDHMCCCCFTY